MMNRMNPKSSTLHFIAELANARLRYPAYASICLCVVFLSNLASHASGQGLDNGSDQSQKPGTIRVLSFNIHHGEGTDGKLDLERIAKVIQTSKADLVALQEVDRNTTRTGSVDQAALLAKLTNMHHAFGANIKLQGGEYGNAVLSRFPITKTKNHPLPLRDNGEQRGVLEVEIHYSPDDPILTMLATHFDHRTDDRERVESAQFLNKLLAQSEPLPAILAGDLNDGPTSRTLVTLESEWKRTHDESLPTIPVDLPTRQIDFVLVRPVARWTMIETRVLDEPIASDHRPILATLQLVP
jgi:endonuclease/exonuclease/phosphatase family metal-dependent hydrolase